MKTAQARWLPTFGRIAPLLTAIALLVCTSATGAVQRRLTIMSDPPGAVVYVDNFPIGTTPVSTNFTYYGTRQIRLVKDGYETLTVLQPIPSPWYEIPPLDFLSENFTPGELRDHRTFTYRLIPQVVVPSEVLRQRGEELRGRAAASGAALSMPAGSAATAPAVQVAPVFPGPASGVPNLPSPPGTAPVAPGVAPNLQTVPALPPALPPTTLPTSPAPLSTQPPGGWTVPQR